MGLKSSIRVGFPVDLHRQVSELRQWSMRRWYVYETCGEMIPSCSSCFKMIIWSLMKGDKQIYHRKIGSLSRHPRRRLYQIKLRIYHNNMRHLWHLSTTRIFFNLWFQNSTLDINMLCNYRGNISPICHIKYINITVFSATRVCVSFKS